MTKAISDFSANKPGAANPLIGLGEYYFGGRTRIFRTAGQTIKGGFGWQLSSFIVYNTLRGIFMNMTPTPMSFTLGFDIPLIGPIAINTIGAFGKGALQSQYTEPLDTALDTDLHSFNRPKQMRPGRTSNLKQLQQDVMGVNSLNGINDFYKTISQIRQQGLATSIPGKYQVRQPTLSNNLLAGILNNFLKPKSIKLGGGGANRYYSSSNTRQDQLYKKFSNSNMGQLRDFYRMIDISSPSVVLIKINHEMDKSPISDFSAIGNTLVLPATIRSISDNDSAQWQDTWNNTGRFQPIKAYIGVTRTIDISFSVFAYTLFNDVNIQSAAKSATRNALNLTTDDKKSNWNKNRDDLLDSASYSNLQNVIQSANQQYHLTMRWLKQLCYPVFDNQSIKRYNVQTNLTIGEYIDGANVIVNSVNISPNQQFYWVHKFPMLVDVSMSFTVFRQTDADNGKQTDLLYKIQRVRQQSHIPGIPSYIAQTPVARPKDGLITSDQKKLLSADRVTFKNRTP